MKRFGLVFAVAVSLAGSAPAVGSAATWRIVPTPTPAGAVLSALNAVSCPRAESCVAVGFYGITHNMSVDRALAEQWNGSNWALQTIPTPAGGGLLSGVSCVSRMLCVAVGQGERGIYSEFYDGASWRVVAMPQPSGAPASLAGVSCSSSSACLAVGDQPNGLGSEAPVAERWDGGAWHVTTPASVDLGGGLSGVSCASASACTAVGFVDLGGVAGTLAERWNGSSWIIEPTPPHNDRFLDGISCVSPGRCTAVGGGFGVSGGIDPLAERLDDVSWQELATPALPGAGGFDSWLMGVACASANECTAVGSDNNSLTLAEAWDRSAWRLQTTPNPAGSTHAQLTAVSCHPASMCTAVGQASFPGGFQALAETTG